MEKELFIEVLRNYSQSTESEAISVITLKRDFPYSQVLQTLSARLTKDYQLFGQKEALQSAAIYAADRAVLKTIMSGDSIVAPIAAVNSSPVGVSEQSIEYHIQPAIANEEPAVEVVKHHDDDVPSTPLNGVHHYTNNWVERSDIKNSNIEEEPIAVVSNSPAEVDADTNFEVDTNRAQILIEEAVSEQSDRASASAEEFPAESVADTVMSDLERLNQLKHDFEVMYAAAKAGMPMPAPSHVTPPVTVPAEPAQQDKVERLIEMNNALNDAPEEPKSESTKPSLLKRRFGANEAYIDEIVNRKELEPESSKQREQLQMIDEFIRTQPSITPGRERERQEISDLSSGGEFTDNIVSETLVEILLKQGKKDKAIEVLKKLIWKFPQKKAYFAAQIEDLKK